ncbi:MAG: glycoside hydrolase family 15 protein [Phycisphaerales bacterium JB063]
MTKAYDNNYHMGLIGNGRTGALVRKDAAMVFACLPDFDSGSAFCSLLDKERGGEMGIAMVGGKPVHQAYREHTNILVTRFEGKDGGFEVIDFMPRYRMAGRHQVPYAPPDIVRVLKPIAGTPRVRISYRPALEYGKYETTTQQLRDGLYKSTTVGKTAGINHYESVYLYSDLADKHIIQGKPFTLERDEHLLLTYNDKLHPIDGERVRLLLAQTEAYWLGWSATTHAPGRYREAILRSALALKLMQFSETGALVAAPTTSLPETIGEERNWDYRFCWIRDASMTVSVLNKIGHQDMAHQFVHWVMDNTPTKDDPLQIMYGLRGERKLTERTLDHLAGYHGSSPVRIGNAAYVQKQHDIYGAVLDVFWQSLDHFATRLDVIEDLWTRVRSVFRTVELIWKKPDRGIWEFRGAKRHFVFSKVLCWVAADRAVRIAERLGQVRWAESHRGLADAIRADICKHGWSEELGAFTQTYGSEALDASNLLMADYGFCAPDDAQYVSTVHKTWENLGRGEGLLMRYQAADDFGEPSSAFTVCCFWGVKALIHIGEYERARSAFEHLLKDTNHLGLLAEDLDVNNRRQLGNFPQAYSHLALIDTALALDALEKRNGEDNLLDHTAS